MKLLRKRICIMGMAVLLGTMTGCESSKDALEGNAKREQNQETVQESTRDIFAMDTYMTITAYGKEADAAVQDAEEEIMRLDALLSTGSEESEVSRLNQSNGGTLSEDTAYLVERSLDFYKKTNGLFQFCIYPVMEAWGFTDQNYHVPSKEELEQAMSRMDQSQLSYDAKTSTIAFGMEGMKIDFGGIAKGYTSHRVINILKDHGIESGLLNLGGNVHALGRKVDGTKWRVAVQNPESEDGYIGVLKVEDQAVITSGGYERYFEQDGKKYHHIIDPRTGYPAQSGLISVTIVSQDGTLADALSTSLYIMGLEDAKQFWRTYSDQFEAILETEDGTIYITEGLEHEFETECTVHVIRKE